MRKIAFALLMIVSVTAYSQRGYLNDYYSGGYGFETTHILKTDLSQMFRANIALIYEYRFHEEYSVEVGVGLLTHSFFRPVFQPKLSGPIYSELKGGYSLHLQPYYYTKKLDGFYTGIPINYRRHGSQAESYEVGICVGYQFHLAESLSLDLEIGWAFNVEFSLDGVSYIYDSGINYSYEGFGVRMLYPLSIKIGYVL